jgi:arginase
MVQMAYNMFNSKRNTLKGGSMEIRRIGAPVNEGCDLPGSQYAIEALREEGLVFDTVVEAVARTEAADEILHLNTLFDFLSRLKKEVRQVHEDGAFPLIFGGDHSLAIATIAAHDNHKRGILWIDAHGDCNTHLSSISKRIHGMPLAIAQGHGHPLLLELMAGNFVASSNILLVGIRSLDSAEEKLMKQWGLKWITQDDITNYGFDWAYHLIKRFLASQSDLHLSFDCDSLDPAIFPGVSTPVEGGLTRLQALDLIDLAFETTFVSSMDIVELNPLRDNSNTLSIVLEIDKIVQSKFEKMSSVIG